MSDTGGIDPKQVSCPLGTEFELEPGAQEDVCVDLEGEWKEDCLVTKHPDLNIDNLEFVSGSVGEGGDHVNITFKNNGLEKIAIDKDRVAIIIKENETETTPAESSLSTAGDGESENMDVDNKEDKTEELSKEASAENEKVDEGGAEDKVNDDQEKDDIAPAPSSEEAKDLSNGEAMDTAEAQVEEKKRSEGEADSAFDQLFGDYPSGDSQKDSDKDNDTVKTPESKETSKEDRETSSSPQMKFANGSAAEDKAMDTEETNGKESLDKADDESKSGDESDKPTIKLASFSSMATSTENGHDKEDSVDETCCSACKKSIPNLFCAIVWETMPFCDEVKSVLWTCPR